MFSVNMYTHSERRVQLSLVINSIDSADGKESVQDLITAMMVSCMISYDQEQQYVVFSAIPYAQD
jgi:hypothetical protein